MQPMKPYYRGFLPYGLGAFLIGIVGGFSTVFSPAFVQELGLPYSNTTWTTLAQAMSTAAFAPILGKLGDFLGRRATLLLGILIFTAGNMLTAVAASLPAMLVARFIVGVGTAAMAPVILAYIVTEFPQNAVAKGFSLYMLISSASVIFGPTLGGWMVSGIGWRSMMWVCAAISGAVFLICAAAGKEKSPRPAGVSQFDGWGAVLVLIFFSLVLCVPSFGQNFGWTSEPFLWVLVGAVISLAGLLAAERRAANPILPGSFLRRKAFLLSIGALFLTQGLMQANMTNIIVFVNYTRPENAVISGYAISILYLGMSLGAVLLGPLADRFPPKAVLSGSLTLTGLGCAAALLFTDRTGLPLLMLSLGLLGFGLGGNGTIFMKVALAGVSTEEAGAGTGTYGLFRDLTAPFGVAVFVPLFTNRVTTLAPGLGEAAAAVNAIHFLAAAEILCVAAGIILVLCLPGRRNQKGSTP